MKKQKAICQVFMFFSADHWGTMQHGIILSKQGAKLYLFTVNRDAVIEDN